MSRDLGRGQNTHVEIDGQRFPLLRDSEVQRRPLVQFPNANKIGPNERPAKNAVLSSITFAANTQRGMGTYKHAVLDGIDTFRRSTLDTRFVGGVIQPPYYDDFLATCPLAANGGDWGDDYPVEAAHVSLVSGEHIFFFSRVRDEAFVYKIATDAWTVTPLEGISAMATWGEYVYFLSHQNVGTPSIPPGGPMRILDPSTYGSATNEGTGHSFCGLADFANRLWSYKVDDRKLYAMSDPDTVAFAAGTAFVAQSEALRLRFLEYVRGLQVYRDKGGRPALYVVTNQRIIGFDDGSGEFEEYEDLRKYAGVGETSHPLLYQWMRDKLLYAIPFGATDAAERHVYQFTGNIDEVGPTDRGGFVVADQFQRFEALGGNVHWLFAACSGDGTNGAGEIVAMNELGGWHTVYRSVVASAASLVRGLCVVGGTIYVMHKDGQFHGVYDQDELSAPHLRAFPSGATGLHEIYFGKTDCGLPNHEKLGASVFVNCRKPDGTTGLSGSGEVVIKYSLDGAAQVTLATLTTATTFPIELPLPGNDAENQDGVVFREIELYASLEATNASAIEEVTLNFSKWEEPRWAYQMVIDLREESFRRFADSTDERRGLGDVREALETLVATKTYHRVRYGCDEWEVDIKAADLVLAGRESPIDGSGLFPITVRDVSAEV